MHESTTEERFYRLKGTGEVTSSFWCMIVLQESSFTSWWAPVWDILARCMIVLQKSSFTGWFWPKTRQSQIPHYFFYLLISDIRPESKVWFSDKRGVVPNLGLPFVIISRLEHDCIFGRDKHKSEKLKKQATREAQLQVKVLFYKYDKQTEQVTEKTVDLSPILL